MNIEIIAMVALAVVVAGGALFSFKVSKQRNRSDVNRTTIRDIDTTGDVAGRDINKK